MEVTSFALVYCWVVVDVSEVVVEDSIELSVVVPVVVAPYEAP